MGCDIHIHVEIKSHDNKWLSGDYYKVNPYFNPNDNEDFEKEYSCVEIHGSRNYTLFTTLAGVRDYSGKNIPVSEPKGFPDNCCKQVIESKESWDGDGHSHSWLTLKELRDYTKGDNNKITYSGLVSKEQSETLDNEGITPDWWCQGSTDKDLVFREWQSENTTLFPLITKLENRYQDIHHGGHGEYNQENDSKIRIVFWFDN